jgi:hypothetical protein
LPRLFVKRGIYRIMMKEGEILTKGKRKEKWDWWIRGET